MLRVRRSAPSFEGDVGQQDDVVVERSKWKDGLGERIACSEDDELRRLLL